jgi:hypothetical protein
LHGRGIVKSLFAPEIVFNRDNVRLGCLGDVTGTRAIEAARRKDANSHLEEALAGGLAAVTGRPRSNGYPSVSYHRASLPHAADYKTGIVLYQSIDL